MPSPKISVVVKTFRPGGFDVLTTSLAQQTFDLSAIELIVVDELHRWRRDTIAAEIKWRALPYPVKHLQTRDSLFPVSCTMRAGNTALSAAEGELWVQAGDHMVMPPGFLQTHWDLYQETKGNAIGVYPYETRRVPEEYWLFYNRDVWSAVESLILSGQDAWSILDWARVNAPTGGLRPDLAALVATCPPPNPDYSSPIVTHTERGQGLNEWYTHYRCDSAPIEAMKKINGWDEEYDGGYGYADVDITIRLRGVGITPVSLAGNPPVQVIDCHGVCLKLSGSAYRDYQNRERLILRRDEPERYQCDFGLVHTDTAKAKKNSLHFNFPLQRSHVFRGELESKLIDASGGWVGWILTKPWLPKGRVHMRTGPQEALAWIFTEPPVLHVSQDGRDGAKFVDILGPEQAQVMSVAHMLTDTACNPGVRTAVLTVDELPVEDISVLVRKVEKLDPARIIITCPVPAAETLVADFKARGISASVFEPDEALHAGGAVISLKR